MLARPPPRFTARGRQGGKKSAEKMPLSRRLLLDIAGQAVALEEAFDFEEQGASGGAPNLPVALQEVEGSSASTDSRLDGSSRGEGAALGWRLYCAPQQQARCWVGAATLLPCWR